jgi:hypothetical protein
MRSLLEATSPVPPEAAQNCIPAKQRRLQDQIILRNCVLNVADVNTDYEKENVKSPEMLIKDDWRTK